MTDTIRSILFVGDVHGGSPYSVCDEEGIALPFGNEVNYVTPNEGQLKIYEYWKYMIEMADRFNVDTVIDLADAIDGIDYKGYGQGVMTTLLDSQTELVTRLYKPVVKGRKFIGCSGSPYHQSRDTRSHLRLCEKLEKYADETLFVGVAGLLTIPEINKNILVAHKASNAMLYTATMLDRELIYQKVAEANKQLPDIHYRVTAHLHKAMHLDNGYQHYLQNPCWKSWYPIKNSTQLIGRRQTDIGFSIVEFDTAGRSTVKLFVWPSPNIAVKEVIL
jgi:hypothetical protein